MRPVEMIVETFPRMAPAKAGLWRRLVTHVRDPLHRDGYALALNSGFTAATGLLYWIVAAKEFSAHAVGLNYALISAMTFLAGIASLNLPNILVRFLPESAERTRIRVISSYAVATVLAACAAVIFVIGVGAWSPRLGFLRSDGGLELWFVFSTLAWCLFVIQDSVLTALGRAVWVPVENAVFSLLKLGLLAGLAAALPRYGIFISWTIAMLASVAGVNLLIFGRLMRRRRHARRGAVDVRNRAFARYFAADYACAVAWLSIISLTPLVVTAVAGATVNAYWALAFSVAYPLYLISQNIGTSLMLHGTSDRRALPRLTRKAAAQGARVLVPAVLLLILLAPSLLSLFGGNYARHSSTVLRLLALGALPNFVVMLATFVARVQRRLGRAVIAFGTQALITLGLAIPLIHAMGVTGVGVAWVCAQSLVAAAILLTWRSWFKVPVAQFEAAERPAAVPSRRGDGGRQDVPAPPRARRNSAPNTLREIHPMLSLLFEALESRGLSWTLLRAPSNFAAPTGDVDLLVRPDDAAALGEAARSLGFVSLPGWESAPDLILIRYDRASDVWLVLDVATSLSFRSPRSWRLADAAEGVLERRTLTSGVPLPADADAFWLLLLHCLLDKGCVAPHYRDRLIQLAPAAMDSPLGQAVCLATRGAFTQSDFIDPVLAGDFEALEDLGVMLSGVLRRRMPMRERARALSARIIRGARKPLLVRRRRGPNLALLGPNGVGKSTAARALQRSLPFEVRTIYMGMWKHAANRSGVARAAEIAVRPARIWFRYLVAQYHQLRGRVVVFDRYVYDALLPPRPPLMRAKRAYFLLLAHALPRPGAAVFLDVSGDVAFGRKHEASPDELESERRLYGELTKRSLAVERIDAGADADTVCAEITTVVWRELARRWQGAPAEA